MGKLRMVLMSGTVILLMMLIATCSDPVVLPVDQNEFSINAETLEWIKPYNEEGLKIKYVNQSNAEVELELGYASDLEQVNYLDCKKNDRNVQCRYESIVLDFPEEFRFENQPICLSIFLIGEDEVIVMPNCSGGSLVKECARLYVNSGEIITAEENFEVSYDTNYAYGGTANKAIVVNTISIENLANGGVLPPKNFVLVRGIGIVRWTDHEDNVWTLVE